MLWMLWLELVVLLLSAAILMWDNSAAQKSGPLEVPVKARKNEKKPR
jgi:hypothetical protein